MEAAHHVDDATPVDVRSLSHEPRIGCVPVSDLDGIHVSGRVLVPQLIQQLRGLGIGAVTLQRLEVGAIRIGVGRRDHEHAVQVDVDLTKQRMHPVIHRSHGIAPVGSGHLRLHV